MSVKQRPPQRSLASSTEGFAAGSAKTHHQRIRHFRVRVRHAQPRRRSLYPPRGYSECGQRLLVDLAALIRANILQSRPGWGGSNAVRSIKRREFVALLCGAAATGLPLVAQAQQPATPVIGYLSLRSREVGFLKGATHGVSQHASATRSRSIAASPARGRLSGRPSSLQIRARGAWRLGRAPRRLDRRRRGRRLAGQRPTPFPAG
jgi:hypothetical protein